MKRPSIFIVAACLLAAGVLFGAAPLEPGARPNVIVILADDQGSIDLGCYGSPDLVTPNTDALAARGVRFTQFYAGAPVCSPSRACLLTGRYPARIGLVSNAPSQPGSPVGMPAFETTIAELLKPAGYRTAHIGKWHLGYSPDLSPNVQGFEHSFGHMGGCIDNFSHFFYWSGPNTHDLHRNGREVYHDGEFFPDLMLREASEFMRRSQGKPFLLYYALNTPHYPYQPPGKWLDRFKHLPYPRNLYAAFLGAQDERIGDLLKEVSNQGLREKTIVIFQSDNGHSTEERAHSGGGSAGRMRGAKFSLFEGGIRVPGIISWPGKIPEGKVRHQMAHAADWFPTLAELCRVPVPDRLLLDGKSLVPVLHSDDAPSPHEFLHWQLGAGSGVSWAVRQGPWKLIVNTLDTTTGAVFPPRVSDILVNLDDDPGELHDRSASNPAIVAALRGLHADLGLNPQ